MDVTNILRRLAALSDPQDDDTQWATCLAATAMDHGISGDDDPDATREAAQETMKLALEVRELAAAARQALEA